MSFLMVLLGFLAFLTVGKFSIAFSKKNKIKKTEKRRADLIDELKNTNEGVTVLYYNEHYKEFDTIPYLLNSTDLGKRILSEADCGDYYGLKREADNGVYYIQQNIGRTLYPIDYYMSYSEKQEILLKRKKNQEEYSSKRRKNEFCQNVVDALESLNNNCHAVKIEKDDYLNFRKNVENPFSSNENSDGSKKYKFVRDAIFVINGSNEKRLSSLVHKIDELKKDKEKYISSVSNDKNLDKEVLELFDNRIREFEAEETALTNNVLDDWKSFFEGEAEKKNHKDNQNDGELTVKYMNKLMNSSIDDL